MANSFQMQSDKLFSLLKRLFNSIKARVNSAPKSTDPSTKGLGVVVQPWRYWIVVAFIMATFGGDWLVRTSGFHIGSFLFSFSYLITPFLLAYCYYSVKEVYVDENAGILVLNKPALEVSAGWYFVPLVFAQLGHLPKSYQQEQFPAEPEQISKMPDDKELRTYMKKPIRVTTAGLVKSESVEVLDSALTLEPTVTVIWQVRQYGFFEFWINIPGKNWDEKYTFLVRILRDTVESELRSEIGKRTPKQIYSNPEQIKVAIKASLTDAVSTWGICIREINVLGTEPGHATNQALEAIPVARANAEATGTTAEATKKQLIVVSEGEAQAAENAARAKAFSIKEIANAEADATKIKLAAQGQGVKMAADAAEMPASEWRAGDVAIGIADKGNLVIGDTGIASLVKIAQAVTGK